MLNLRIEPEEHVLRFGAFTLDVPARTLMYRSKPVALAPKEFDILAALALARGTPVTQDQLVALAWAGEATADSVLFQTVYRLRRALIDHDGLTDYIAVVPGRGYLFTAPVLPLLQPRDVPVPPTHPAFARSSDRALSPCAVL